MELLFLPSTIIDAFSTFYSIFVNKELYIHSMRLRTLHLKNMRLFGEEEQVIHFSDEHNVSIIVGNNSSGKSSILDSIAIEVSS